MANSNTKRIQREKAKQIAKNRAWKRRQKGLKYPKHLAN